MSYTGFNTSTDPGDTFAADVESGEQHPKVKIEFDSGGNAIKVSAANPLPVEVFNLPAIVFATGQTVALPTNQLVALPTNQLVALPTSTLVGLTPAALSALETISIGALATGQTIGLDTATLAALETIQIGSLPTAQIPALGQTTMAGSLPVVLASDQSAIPVSAAPGSTNGTTGAKIITTASTNATRVKASAGSLHKLFAQNFGTAIFYVKLHDTASAPTAGTGVVATYGLFPGQTLDIEFPGGKAFGTGIGVTTVTGLADNNSSAAAANNLIMLEYK